MKQEVKVFDTQSLKKSVSMVVGTRPGIIMFAPSYMSS